MACRYLPRETSLRSRVSLVSNPANTKITVYLIMNLLQHARHFSVTVLISKLKKPRSTASCHNYLYDLHKAETDQ
jgi:hypothetical protein